MTVEENYKKLEPNLKCTLATLALLGITPEQQATILRLLKYDIDRAYNNGFQSAMEYATDEVKKLEI